MAPKSEEPKSDKTIQAARELTQIMRGMCKHEQNVMTWLIDIKIKEHQGDKSMSDHVQIRKLQGLC